MKILCVCDQGNNRSVQFAHLLKYWGHDTLSIGLSTTTEETTKMLCDWADKIVVTHDVQMHGLLDEFYQEKCVLFDVGPDTYPRPFNKELHEKAKKYLEDNKSWLKPNQ